MLAALCWPAANVKAQCAPPTNFTVSNITETSATLTWTASSSGNVSQYELNRSTVEVTDFNQYPDFWDSQAGIVSSNSVIQFHWTDLDPGTTYYCYLRTACSDYTESEYVSLSFTTDPGCKKPVVTLSKQIFDPNSIFFDFKNPNFHSGDSYKLEVATGPKGTFNLNNPSTYSLSWYTDETDSVHYDGHIDYLEPGTNYSLAMRVNCIDGTDTSWSEWTKVMSRRTDCEGVALPYTEDFDSYTEGVSSSQYCEASYSLLSFPECWNFLNLSETSYRKPLAFLTSSSSLAKSGNALLMYSSLETPVYALLPTFTGTANQPLELSFHYAYMTNNASSSGTLSVGYITSYDGNYFDPSNFVELYSCPVTNQMTLSSETINNLPTNARLAFRFTAANENFGVVIDEVKVTTHCLSFTLPYTENFDSYTQGVSSNYLIPSSYPDVTLPDCWTFLNRSMSPFNNGANPPYVYIAQFANYAVSGKTLVFKASPSIPMYVALPLFEENIHNLKLSFYYRNESSDDGNLIVGYMTDPSDASTFVELRVLDKVTTMTLAEVTFEGVPLGVESAHIAFKSPTAYTGHYLGIDEVTVETRPCAPVVVDATHPFTDNFESDQCWQLVNGNNTNAWAWGHPSSSMLMGAINGNFGNKALYISNDNGTTTAYSNDSPSVVYVTKQLSLSAGDYAVRYDWFAFGETDKDYLRVALVPASVELAASTSTPAGLSATTLPDGWIALDGGTKKNGCTYLDFSTFESDSITVTEPGDYKVVFVWCNDASGGSLVGAVIDDFTFNKISCPKPYNLAVGSVTDTKATVTFYVNPDPGSYTYILDKSEDFDIMDSSKYVNTTARYNIIQNLVANTSYTVAVRANCTGGGNSAWTEPVSFMTRPSCGGQPAITFTIGDQTNKTSQIPYYSINSGTYEYAASWQIFTAEEILNGATFAGDITSLAWKNDRDVTNTFQIFMCQTDKTSFDSATDTIARSTMTKVYEGAAHFTHDVWSKVVLDTPFAYDGTHNLLVMVNRTLYISSNSKSEFEYSTTDDYKTIASYGFEGLTSFERTTNRNNTRFTMCVNQNSCTYMTIPYSENFDAYTACDNNSTVFTLPYCWNRVNTGSFNSTFPYIYTSTTPGDNQLIFATTADANNSNFPDYPSGDQIAVLPQVDISNHPMNTLQVTLGIRSQDYNEPFKLIVGVMSDPTDRSTFVPVSGTLTPASNTSFSNFTVSFSSYTGSGSYIALMAAKPNSGNNQGWVDNVLVELDPCGPVVVDATHPFTDNFEGDICWLLINGDRTNTWVIGDATNHGGSKSLYISNDGGATNAYSTNTESIVYATKLVSLSAGQYAVSYDWKARGSEYDYLRAVLVPASVELTAGSSLPTGFGTSVLPAGWIALDGGTFLTENSDWTTFETNDVEVTETGNYRVVFLWRNSVFNVYNPPAAIDNFSISRIPCSRPLNLRVRNLTSNSARVLFQPTWSENNGLIYYVNKTADFNLYAPGNQYTSVNDTVIALTNLLPNTSYTIAIRANCGDVDTSGWNTYTFTTLCTPIATLPYTEDFDSYTEGVSQGYNVPTGYPNVAMPECWMFHNVSQSASFYPQAFLSSGESVSGNALRFNSHSAIPVYAVLPAFQEDIHHLLLSFSYHINGNFQVGYMTDPSDPSTFVHLFVSSTVSTAFTPKELTFENVPANITSAHIAFRYIGGLINQAAKIDNVSVEIIPPCRKAYDACVTGTTDASVSLRWSAVSGASGYQILYGPTSTFDTHDVLNGVYEGMEVSTTTATITGLTANTDYTFAVRTVCANFATLEHSCSDWTFVTTSTRRTCGTYAVLPYTENFNSYTYGISNSGEVPAGYPNVDLPSCWTFLNRSDTTGTYPMAILAKYNALSSDKTLFLKSGKNKSIYAILPAFNEDLRNLKLSFTYRNADVTEASGTLSVGYLTDPTDSNSFVLVQSLAKTETMTDVEVLFNTLPAAAASARIAFRYTGGTANNYYLRIDDVSVVDVQCPGIATLPYTENFDSFSNGISTGTSAPTGYPNVDMPECWTFLNRGENSSDKVLSFLTSYSPYVASGNSLLLKADGTNGDGPLYAVLPYFYEDIHNLMLTFSYMVYSGRNCLSLGYMTDPSDASTFVNLHTYTSNTEMTEVEELFETVPANIGTVYIAFECDPDGSSLNYVAIDNVRIEVAPSCRKPRDLAVTATTTSSVSLSWTDINENGAQYRVAYGPKESFDLSNSSTYQIVTVSTDTTTVRGLSAGTNYTFAVRARCSTNTWSAWSSAISVRTACTAIATLPYVEDFNSYITNIGSFEYTPMSYPNTSMPECWTFLNRCNSLLSYPLVYLTASSDYAVSGTTLLFNPSHVRPVYASLPAFDVDFDNVKLSFSYRNRGTEANDSNLIVGYMTNPWDASTFVEVQRFAKVTEMTDAEVTFDGLSVTAGAHIAFKVGGFNMRYISIDNVKVELTGPCAPVVVDAQNPYTDDFESDQCWQLINGNCTNTWAWGEAVNHSGSKALYISNDGGTTNAYTNNQSTMVYATKLFSLPAGGYAVSYDWKADGETGFDFLRVALVPASVAITAGLYMPAGFSKNTLPASWIAMDGGAQLNKATNWQTFRTEDLIVPTSGDYRVVFAWRNDNSGGTNPPVAVDNFSISKIACPRPKNLMVQNITHNSATLQFTSSSEASDYTYILEVTSSFDTAHTSQYLTISGLFTQFTSLQPNTSYTVAVRSNCGDGVHSSWGAPYTFTTLCNPITTLPFTENFDSHTGSTNTSVSTNNLPDCWNYINTGSSSYYSGYPIIYNSSTYAASGSNAMRFYLYSSSSYDCQMAILPLIDPTLYTVNSLQLSFDARNYDSYTFTAVVGILSDPSDKTTFTPIDTIVTNSNTYAHYESLFSHYTGNGGYIAIMAPKPTETAYNIGYIDNIVVKVSTCPIPKNVMASNRTQNSLNLSWTEVGSASAWDIEYGLKGFTQGTGTKVHTTSNPCTISGLTPSTEYDFYVRANCDGGDSSSFTNVYTAGTECLLISDMPFTENFDSHAASSTTSVMTNNLPYCWNYLNTGTQSSYAGYPILYYNSSSAASGKNSLRFYVFASTYFDDQVAVLPQIDVLANPVNTLQLAFDARCNSDPFTAVVGVMTNPTNKNSFVPVDTIVTISNTYTHYEFPLSHYTGNGGYIAIMAPKPATGYNTGSIDNIVVDTLPSCITPKDVTVSYITLDSITLSWTEMGTATAWDIEYGPIGFTQGNGTIVTGVTYKPYTITGLAESTAYDFYVRANCGNSVSNYSNRVSTSTTCAPISLPLFENFDAYEANTSSTMTNLPYCWSSTNTGTSYIGLPNLYPSTSYAASGMNSLRFYVSTSSSYHDQIAVLPQIDVTTHPMNTVKLTLDAQNYSTDSDFTFKLFVGVMTDPTDETTFDIVDSIIPGSTDYASYTVEFSDYGGAGSYIALMAKKSAPKTNAGYVDNVKVFTCSEPMNVTASNPTTTSIDLSWTEMGSASAWEIEYGPAGFTHGNGTTVTVTSKPYTVTGLSHSTAYDFYVRANCGSGNISLWSDKTQATTAMAPVGLPYTADFTNANDRWVLNNGTCPNYWIKGTVDSEGALFVTTDGTTPGYNIISNSIVSAQKLFTVGTYDSITISFDVMVAGEESFDYLKMFLAPASMQYPASTTEPTSGSYGYYLYNTYAYNFYTNGYVTNSDFKYTLSNLSNTIHVVAKMPNPNASPTSSSTAQLVFAWKNDNGVGIQPPAIIKNLKVEYIPECLKPTNLASTAITTNSVTLAWTEVGDATSWVVTYGHTGFTPGTSAAMTETVHTNSCTITGLTPATQYDFYVQPDCDGNKISDVLTVTTECGKITALPFMENFDAHAGSTGTSVYVNNLPYCWSNINTGSTYSGYPIIYTSATYAASGNNSMRFYTYSTSTYSDQIAILPQIDVNTIPMNTLQLSFDAREHSTSYPFSLVIGVMTDPTDVSTFVPVQTITTQSTTYANFEVPFTQYTGTGSYIALKAPKPASGYNYGYVDNIMVEIAPLCPKPTNVFASNITADGADINWLPGGSETDWEIAVVPHGMAITTGTPEAVSTHPYTLTNLNDNTSYDVYVRADCGTGTDFSSWSQVCNFSTTPLCSAPTDVTVSQIAGTSALVTWTDALFGATGYTVAYKETGQSDWASSQSVTGNSAILSGLNPSTAYTVTVYSNCDQGTAAAVTKTFTTNCLAGGEIQIGNGTETSYYIPLNNYYKYSYTQQIFLASELNGVSTINSIAFQYAYSSPSTSKDSVKIYLAHTTKSYFSGTSNYEPTTNFQLVYTGPMNCQQGWNTFNFTTPFQYNGTDNLLVVVDDNSGDYDGGNYAFNAHTTSSFLSLYYFSDITNPDPSNPTSDSPSSYISKSRCNIKLFGPCDNTITCIAPNVYVSDVTGNSMTLAWVPGDKETSWEIEYRADNNTTWTSVGTVSSSPYTFTHLMSNTVYHVRMRSVCGGDEYSNWFTLSQLTECGTISSMPYVENFDTYGTGSAAYPRCWGKITTYSYYPYINSTRYDGSGSLYFYAPSASKYNIALTPEFDASIPINTLQATFMYRAYYPEDLLEVGVMTSPTDTASFVAVDTVYPGSTASTWIEKEVHFSGYTGNGHYIAFRNAYITRIAYGYIDNLIIDLIPTCPRPVHVTAANATPNSIELSWDQDGTPASWVIEYGAAGFVPGTGTKVTATTNPFTVTGLSHSTLYDFYVTAVCGVGDSSATSIVFSAATSCSAIDALPYVNNFDIYGTGTGTYPICWSKINTASDDNLEITTTSYNGVGSLYFYAGTGTYNIAITPEFDASIPVNTLQATFMYRANGATDRLVVGVMTNPSDTASFMAVDTIYPGGTPYSWVKREVFFNGYTGGGHFIAFKNEYTSSASWAFFDSLNIDLIPACSKPNHLAVTDVTTTSVTLDWTPTSSETSWEIAYGAPGFNPDSTAATIVTANTHPFTVQNLNMLTPYEFYVRARCSSTEASPWSDYLQATTSMVPVGLPYTADFTDANDAWLLNNGSCTNYWT